MKTIVNLFLSFFLLPHIVNAFDITQILNKYPEFTSFNNLLTQSKLSSQINSRESVTVLVIENSKLFPVSGKPPQIIAKILSVHVLLDYFDIPKLKDLKGGPTTVTTLLQATGQARGQQGFLNVTKQGTNVFTFGSSIPRPTPTSNLVKTIFTEGYNISVLQISGAILPPGIDSPAGPQTSATGLPGVAIPPAVSGGTKPPVGLIPPAASQIPGVPKTPGGAIPPATSPPRRPVLPAMPGGPISPAASQTPGGAISPATSPGTSQAQPPSTDTATAPPTSSGGSRSTAPPAITPSTSQTQAPPATSPSASSGGSSSTAPSGSSNGSQPPSGSQITISPSLSQGNASTPPKGGGGAPTGAAEPPGATPGSSGGSGSDASSPASGSGSDASPPASDSGGDAPPGKEAPPAEEKTPAGGSESSAAGRAHHGGLAVVCTVAAANLFLAMRV